MPATLGPGPTFPGGGDEEPLTPLRRAAASGVRWTSMATVAIAVFHGIQLIVLAQLLTSAELGLVGLLLVAISLGTAIGDFGISSGLVARQTQEPETLSTLFWANIAAGLLTAVLITALAPLAAEFFDAPELSGYGAIVGAGIVFNAVGQQSMALLQRDLLFARIAVSDTLGAAGGAVGTAVAAVAGAGAASIAVGFACAGLVRTSAMLFSHRKVWLPAAVFRRSRLPWYLRFGAYNMAGRVVIQLSGNVDYIVVGRFIGAAPLGAYTLAYEVGVNPYQRLNPVLTRVAFPVFAKRQSEDRALRAGYLELLRLIGFTVLPLLVGIAVLSEELVPVFFGDGWELASTLLPILAVVGVMRALDHPSGAIMLAKQRADLQFKLAVMVLAIMAGALTAAAAIGDTKTVAWTYAGLQTAVFLVIRRIVLGRLIGLRLSSLLAALAAPARVMAIAAGLTLLARPLVAGIEGDLVPLLVLGFVYVSAVAVQMVVFERPYLREIARLVRARSPVDLSATAS